MIFVTVGTTVFPFLRMRSIVESLTKNNSKEKIMYQHGNVFPVASPVVRNFHSLPYLKINHYMKRARIIICHGGPATIFQALAYGKIPVVIPREKRFGEHVSDHQVQFVRCVEKQGFVRMVSDVKQILMLKHKPIARPLSANHAIIEYLTSLMNFNI